jgi:hypothetical protein
VNDEGDRREQKERKGKVEEKGDRREERREEGKR